MNHTPSQRSNGFALAIVVESALAVAAVFLAWLFGIELREQFPTTRAGWIEATGRGIVATVPMLVAFWWLARSSNANFVHLRKQVEQVVGELFPSASLPQFALVAVLAGVGEEILFRGVLQTLLASWTTPVVGLILASLLFGAAHALSRTYFILATLIGAYFGWLLLRYNDLVAPIVAHSLYDFVALAYIAKNRSQPTPSESPNQTPENESAEPRPPAHD